MSGLSLSFVLLTAPLFIASCNSPAISQSTPLPSPTTQTLEQSSEQIREVADYFVKGESLPYKGYEVKKLYKRVRLEDVPKLVEVSYAVLKKDGREIADFDGVYFGVGNATDFGLFSFLGGEDKQLVVSQTIPRGGRHWVVSLSPGFRIIYDSAGFEVGREGLWFDDIDKDGRHEIMQEVTEFFGFEDMASAESPLPLIIFKYDDKAKQYLPANHLFQNYALKDIEDRIQKINSTDDQRGYLARRLDILLDYVFAGNEKEGWGFFEREYTRDDKGRVEREIKSRLKKQAVYKFIYK